MNKLTVRYKFPNRKSANHFFEISLTSVEVGELELLGHELSRRTYPINNQICPLLFSLKIRNFSEK